MNSIDIGPGPCADLVEQANTRNYRAARAQAECRAFIGQLRRILGEEPEGAQFYVKHNRDGTDGYYSVECRFEEGNRAAIDYAFSAESSAPEKWDAIAKAQLADVPTGAQA